MTARVVADRLSDRGQATAGLLTAVVLCRDARLWRFFEIELSRLGVRAVARLEDAWPTSATENLTSESIPTDEGAVPPICLAVFDADEFFPKGDTPGKWSTEKLPDGCGLLAFGRQEPTNLPAGCIFLRRPFDLLELEYMLRDLTADLPRAAIPTAPLWDVLRMRATESRRGKTDRNAMYHAGNRVDAGLLLTLDEARGEAVVGTHRVALTKTETTLLRLLLAAPGTTVPREVLAAAVSGGGNTVDVYVCRLRAKIEKPLGRRMIRTVRGVGYVLA